MNEVIALTKQEIEFLYFLIANAEVESSYDYLVLLENDKDLGPLTGPEIREFLNSDGDKRVLPAKLITYMKEYNNLVEGIKKKLEIYL